MSKLAAVAALIILLVVVGSSIKAKPPQTGGLVCTPALDFGTVQFGTKKTMQIVCTNTSNAPITIQGVTITGNGFSLEPDEPSSLQILLAKVYHRIIKLIA